MTSCASGGGAAIDAAWLAQQLQQSANAGGQALGAGLGVNVGGELNFGVGSNIGLALGGGAGLAGAASALQGNAYGQLKLGVRPAFCSLFQSDIQVPLSLEFSAEH